MADTFVKNREIELKRFATLIAGTFKESNYIPDYEVNKNMRVMVDMELKQKSEEGYYRIMAFDKTSTVIYDSHDAYLGKTIIVNEVVNALQGQMSTNLQSEGNVIYAASGITDDVSKVVGSVLLVSSIDEIFEPIWLVQGRLIFYTAIILCVVTLLVFFICQILIDPLKNIMAAVEKMSQGHLNIRTNITSSDEFSEMGKAFNSMAQKLELVEKTREEFVSNVSHELKTPLSSIKVLTESILLQENVPTEMYTEFLQDINSEIDRMTFIINDLLILVKLDQREIPLKFSLTDLNKMAMDLLKRLLPLAQKKNIEMIYEEIKTVSVYADEMKLSLAISNLVENAVKYTNNGGCVKITVDADHQNAFITVSDTGIGINEEEQAKIFTRFYRVDKTRDRETGGTGLGLAITHSTVLLHNGSIRISSKENEGTSFIVRLPLSQVGR